MSKQHRSHRHPHSRIGAIRDRGNVLPLVLVMMVVGSLMVTALLTFAITLLRNRPPLEERSDSLEAVRSAMRMAIVMQRDHGPEGCYDATDPSFVINGRSVTIQCQTLAFENDNGGRYGLIATTNNGEGNGAAPDNESIHIEAGNDPKEVLGSVFMNGGQLAGDNAGITLIDGQLAGSTYSSAATSPYRYSQVDINTDLTFPDDGSVTCASLFGPDALEQTFENQLLLSNAAAPLSSTYRATGVRVEPAAGFPNTQILGVLVPEDATTLRLDRSPDTSGRFDIDYQILIGDPDVTACYQDVDAADPTYVPRGFTTCDGALVDPELVEQTGALGDGILCEPTPWWDIAGWKPALLPDYIYPMLPQVPTYPRSSDPYPVGPAATATCHIFYPGRYSNPINLQGGHEYYFASGVYLLNDTLTVEPGAQVVAGEGTYKGCAFDADAAFLTGSPRSHEITGKGATFLLGSNVLANSSATPTTNGQIIVDDGSLRINRRVATTSTRASSGISVMSINLERSAASPDDVEIPANDRVLLPSCLASEIKQYDEDEALTGTPNPCAADVAGYSITPTTSIGEVRYTKSGLGPDDAIISVELDGGDRNTNRVLFGGNVFVPNAKIEMSRSSNTDDYAMRMGNGAVASSFSFDFPVGDDSNFLIGQETETAYAKVKLVATTTFNGQDFRSVAELEVDVADRYAINNWTVDAGSGDLLGGGSGTHTSSSSDSAASDAGTDTGTDAGTDSGTDTGTDAGTDSGTDGGTDTGTDAGTDTGTDSGTDGGTDTGTDGGTDTGTDSGSDGGPTVDPCLADTAWTAEWWNNRDLSGTPVTVNNPAAIANNWGSGYPKVNGVSVPGIGADHFSVRWTRKITVPADGDYTFIAGGDDGYRMKIDGGPWIINNWDDHSYEEDEVTVALTAGCAHEVVFEYYERTGSSSAVLSYDNTPALPSCTNTHSNIWEGEYYNSTNSSRARNDWRNWKFSSDTSTIDFDWGNGSPWKNKLGNDTYSIRWSRTVNLEQPGTYEFSGGGNNGYRLFVNGTEVFEDWGNGTLSWDSGQIEITERCDVELVFEYYENTGSAEVWLNDWTFVD